jgi:hypothetical protein
LGYALRNNTWHDFLNIGLIEKTVFKKSLYENNSGGFAIYRICSQLRPWSAWATPTSSCSGGSASASSSATSIKRGGFIYSDKISAKFGCFFLKEWVFFGLLSGWLPVAYPKSGWPKRCHPEIIPTDIPKGM